MVGFPAQSDCATASVFLHTSGWPIEKAAGCESLWCCCLRVPAAEFVLQYAAQQERKTRLSHDSTNRRLHNWQASAACQLFCFLGQEPMHYLALFDLWRGGVRH